jgi:hypothetical protein
MLCKAEKRPPTSLCFLKILARMGLGNDATSITKQLQPFGLVPARLCRVSKVHTEAVPISLPSE